MSMSKGEKHAAFGPLFDVEPFFLVAGAVDSALHLAKRQIDRWSDREIDK